MDKKNGTKSIIAGIFPKINSYSIIAMIFCVIMNIAGHYITRMLNMPFWLDTLGTMVIAIQYGPLYGAIVGAVSVILLGVFEISIYNYVLVGVAVGLIIGLFFLKKNRELLAIITAGMITGIISSLISVPLDIYNYGTGKVGNLWGNAFYDLGA